MGEAHFDLVTTRGRGYGRGKLSGFGMGFVTTDMFGVVKGMGVRVRASHVSNCAFRKESVVFTSVRLRSLEKKRNKNKATHSV